MNQEEYVKALEQCHTSLKMIQFELRMIKVFHPDWMEALADVEKYANVPAAAEIDRHVRKQLEEIGIYKKAEVA